MQHVPPRSSTKQLFDQRETQRGETAETVAAFLVSIVRLRMVTTRLRAAARELRCTSSGGRRDEPPKTSHKHEHQPQPSPLCADRQTPSQRPEGLLGSVADVRELLARCYHTAGESAGAGRYETHKQDSSWPGDDLFEQHQPPQAADDQALADDGQALRGIDATPVDKAEHTLRDRLSRYSSTPRPV